MKYDGVIFDKDGVLLNSGDFEWADELRMERARQKGIDLNKTQARKIVKLQSMEDLEKLREETGIDREFIRETGRVIAEKKIEKMRSGEVKPFNSVQKVLETVESPKSVVSNAPQIATEFAVDHFGLEKHFEKVLSPSLGDLEAYLKIKKPSTVMLEEAIEAMNASNPIMIGDSTDDIRAARNLGIDSIHVKTNGGVDVQPTYKAEKLRDILDILN